MINLLKHLPPAKEALLVYSICVLPNHIWSIVNTLRDVPAWLIKMSLWEVISVIAYIQTIALIESVILFMGLVVISIILPGKIIRENFLTRSSFIIFFLTSIALIAHFTTGIRPAIIYCSILIIVFAIIFFISNKYFSMKNEQLTNQLSRIYERLVILSLFYILIDIVGVLIVVFRNF